MARGQARILKESGYTFLLGALIPLAILISRDRLRRYRRGVLVALEDWISKHAQRKPLPSFEVARIKYEMAPRDERRDSAARNRDGELAVAQGSMLTFALPAFIYAALSALCFTTAIFLAKDRTIWTDPNFILSGINALSQLDPNDVADIHKLAIYQWNTGAAIIAGFLGAYLFTLQYLVQRVRNYELSPTSFLVASVSILESIFVVAIARHLMFSDALSVEFTPVAFLLGYFPHLGISWLVEQVKLRNLKRTAPTAYDQRSMMPTDMVDGVDMLSKFRLMEAGVRDVQNLATANPVLLYVETPFNMMTILDWIAQAQLIVALGGARAADLRMIGVRTIFDLEKLGKVSETRRLVLKEVWPAIAAPHDQTEEKAQYDVLVDMITGNVHVRRLRTFWNVMTYLVEREELVAEPVAEADGKRVPLDRHFRDAAD